MIMINTYMRNYLKLLKPQKGFTLIELLVVIGILGILAAALIATIDPFEQLRKADDANVKNTAVEFVNANIRYYTTHSILPWDNTNAPAACQTGGNPSAAGLGGTQLLSCLGDPNTPNTIIGDGELKQGFTSVTSILSSILVTGTSNSITACFLPQSKSQLADANTKYSSTGVVTTGCISQGSTNKCYWCSE